MKHNDNIIGKKNLFAIQYSIEQTKKPYIWGHRKKAYDFFLKKGIVDDVFKQFLEQFNSVCKNFN